MRKHCSRTIAICGHHEAGKDEAAEFLCATYFGLRYGRSISYYLAPVVAERLQVPVEVLRGPDRHRYADDFFRIGEEVRHDDIGYFMRQSLERGNVITGIRDPREVAWGRQEKEVDLFVWIDRPVPIDPTMRKMSPDLCDVVVRNHGSLQDFYRNLSRLAEFAGFMPIDRLDDGVEQG